ncbi:MAG: hypothetical protein Q7R43_04660, partial [Candidatus Daviesbacteria bacterium]|nr:hypothetical protein [Candidatus Daviesbacteria bacterium]
MDYQLPNEVKIILEKFTKANYQIYIVGGSVRDLIMGRDVHDWDFTTDAKPEDILKLFPEGFYDNNFGTVGVVFENQGVARDGAPQQVPAANEMSEDIDGAVERQDPQVFEITTMRKEGEYQDFRHPEKVSWTNKIEEDLARRDFTMNSIALSADGKIVDPFSGQVDIKNKIIKAVGEPDKRFKEDALRLLRAIRFSAQLGFDIE